MVKAVKCLERLWDPRLEVWACRGSGADPGAQEQALCWDHSLWDDASPARSSSLLLPFSAWMSWRTDVSHPLGIPRTHRSCPPTTLRAAAAAGAAATAGASHCLGTEARSLIPELGCAWAEMPQGPPPLCQDPHAGSGSSSGALKAQGHLAVDALICMFHF